MKIYYTPEFIRRYKRLSEAIMNLTKEKIGIFLKDPFNPILRTHKLHGKYKGFSAFSITYDCRIIFKFERKDEVRFYSIGGHSVYNR